jgi:transposase
VLAGVVAAAVSQIGLLNAEVARLERDAHDVLAAHPKAALLKDLPRVATVSLAQLIAELGPLLDRCQNAEQVAAICGAVPVTRESGKSRTVGFRYAANKPARVAITGFADNSRHSSAWAADRYRQARERGARHPHAVRVVARGWIRVIWACWQTGIAYDPSRHRGEQLATTGT